MIGHKFTISVTMDVSPFAWCLGRAVLNTFSERKFFVYVHPHLNRRIRKYEHFYATKFCVSGPRITMPPLS